MSKRRVTMTNVVGGWKHEAVDLVPEEQLEEYVQDARTRWAVVEVSDTPEEG